MKSSIGSIRLVRSLVCVAACVASTSLLAGEPTEIAPGQWVRVTTGTEVTGEGFAMSPGETQGKSLSHDKRTMTFDVKGQAVRVAKPGVTVDGAVQVLDEKTLVLQRAGESSAVVVPRDAIVRVDMRQRRSWKGRGAAIGAGAGLAVGVLAGVLSGSDECAPIFESLCFSAGDKAVIFSIVAVPIGALLGVVAAPGDRKSVV